MNNRLSQLQWRQMSLSSPRGNEGRKLKWKLHKLQKQLQKTATSTTLLSTRLHHQKQAGHPLRRRNGRAQAQRRLRHQRRRRRRRASKPHHGLPRTALWRTTWTRTNQRERVLVSAAGRRRSNATKHSRLATNVYAACGLANTRSPSHVRSRDVSPVVRRNASATSRSPCAATASEPEMDATGRMFHNSSRQACVHHRTYSTRCILKLGDQALWFNEKGVMGGVYAAGPVHGVLYQVNVHGRHGMELFNNFISIFGFTLGTF